MRYWWGSLLTIGNKFRYFIVHWRYQWIHLMGSLGLIRVKKQHCSHNIDWFKIFQYKLFKIFIYHVHFTKIPRPYFPLLFANWHTGTFALHISSWIYQTLEIVIICPQICFYYIVTYSSLISVTMTMGCIVKILKLGKK